MDKTVKKSRAFTLIEVLIVLTIVTMLAAVVVIAINPARQFAQARNTQRWSSVNDVLEAIHRNIVDNNGNFDFSGCGAASFPSASTEITVSGGVNLCACLVPKYLAEFPYDPTSGSYIDCATYDSGYNLFQDAAGGRITVSAPSAELGDTISVTR